MKRDIFPIQPTKITHKFGGRITRITGIAHTLGRGNSKRSEDSWHFIGNVEWDDGGKSVDTEIAPWAICTIGDAGRDEAQPIFDALSDYLNANGEWDNYGWRAHRGTTAKKGVV